MAAFFVAKVKGLPSGIAHGIVVPGGEAELVGILAPRVGRTALGDNGAKAEGLPARLPTAPALPDHGRLK